MIDNISKILQLLYDKNNSVAYKALQTLQKEAEISNALYGYMDQFSDMLESDNSYIRTRGLILIAYHAKWDVDHKLDEVIDLYLRHITDSKPITARQCVKLLPMIAEYKPDLREDIILALQKADTSIYADSMQPLVQKDIQETLKTIQE